MPKTNNTSQLFLIDRDSNRISKIPQKTFSELGFTERKNLQEWIANDPSSLGEELLIIQKEFNGFDETNERLDLLALDKSGNLVIIENKLDDSGKDVTGQAIKYASYCASLTKQNILKIYQDFLGSAEDAEERISDFFDNRDISEIVLNPGLNSQRIILLAANFRKEVTSTVLWLLNFKIRLQCFKVTPLVLEDKLMVDIKQILPTEVAEDFAIGIATKTQEEIEIQQSSKKCEQLRVQFWEQFINYTTQATNLFSNNTPTHYSWIAKGIGMAGVTLNLSISRTYCRTEIYFNPGSQEENKEIFDFIFKMKDKIESDFGNRLVWERMDEKKSCRIKYQLDGVSYYQENDLARMNEFLVDASFRMERAFRDPIKKLNEFIKNKKTTNVLSEIN